MLPKPLLISLLLVNNFMLITPGKAQSWQALYDSSEVYWERSEYAKAVQVLEQALPLTKALYENDKKDPTYGLILNDLGICYISAGNPQKAENIILESLVVNKAVLGENHIDYAILLNNAGRFYVDMGKFPEAERYYKQSIQTYINISEQQSIDYTFSINNLALLYLETGRFQESEQLHKQLIALRKEIVGEKHPDYAQAVNNLAGLYTEMGLYSQAEQLFQESLRIRKEVLGEHHADYGNSLHNLAALYADDLNKHAEAESLFKKAIANRKAVLGEQHPNYAISLNGLANLYTDQGNYQEAASLHKQATEIREAVFGKKHPSYAKSLANAACLYYKTGELTKAEALYKEALAIYKEAFGGFHPDYASILTNLASTYVRMDEIKQAATCMQMAEDNFLQQIRLYLPFLSEKEKGQFLQTTREHFEIFNSFALWSQAADPAVTGEMYNNQLVTKALLLDASRKVLQSIRDSGDTNLQQQFENWQQHREALARYYRHTQADLTARQVDLDSLEDVANDLEKKLSAKSAEFSQAFLQQYDWKDVQKQLHTGEAALEMIRFRKYGFEASKKFTDTVSYAALIVTPDAKYPKLVVLEQGNLLETRLLKAYRNDMQTGRHESNAYAYYWLPLIEPLKGVKKLYFSPDGVYHQINPVTLYNPVTATYLLDELEIVTVTSTRDILTKEANKEALAGGEALLVGNPSFDLSPENYQQQLALASISPAQTALLPLKLERGYAPMALPGTRQEIEQVDELLKRHQIHSQRYLQDNALEEVIKQVDKPRILHIATHGFFEPDANPENPYQNPLLRSGLLLAGASRTLNDTSTFDLLDRRYTPEDGILTAYEAMNLNLNNTELVVLSACETGLGDIGNGEGVYGLQRAFTIAGAEAVLMSLWKVNDRATQSLMIYFYEYWLGGGNKSAALKQARLQSRLQYPDPYYWGAFVLIGE